MAKESQTKTDSSSSDGNEPSQPKGIDWSAFSRHLLLTRKDQEMIAALFVIAALLAGTIFVVWHRGHVFEGYIDIDRSQRQVVEFKVDINSAEWPEIVVLPGIGEKLAKSIVEYRKANGRFTSHAQLENVPGIGQSKVASVAQFLLPIETVASNTSQTELGEFKPTSSR